MNEFEEFLLPLSTAEILERWEKEIKAGTKIPTAWNDAIKSHLANRELSAQEQQKLNKINLVAAKVANEKKKPDSGNLLKHKLLPSFNFSWPGYVNALLAKTPIGWQQIRQTIWPSDSDKKEKEQFQSISGDRDQLLVKHILEKDGQLLAMNHASSHIGIKGLLTYHDYQKPVALKDFNTGQERIVLTICPSWGVIFPPYGLAKMTGTLRKEGYACKVYDLNIQLYHRVLKNTGIDYWRAEKHFYWQDSWFYEKHLARIVSPFLLNAVDAIVADNPTIVGFSLYSTNLIASLYMIKELRKRLPKVIIVAGGPSAAIDTVALEKDFKSYVNYFFKGEAEESFLNCLKDGTFKKSAVPEGVFIGKLDSKIPLNEKAFADYSDYDLTAYTHKDGASIETSRGCVAQCSFCTETYFWKFRSMTPQRVIDEMKYQIENYGFKRFWFVDSLVNGDLKNFKLLVDLIIENNLQIGWNSYSRCDGRMTKEFISKVAESGCTGLSYGVESGSQKVLNDMRKKIDVWEIYNNLRDTYLTGKIWTHVNWLIGFPTEENIDFYHSNILIYNVRKYIHHLSPGMGCGISELADLHTRAQVYGIPWKERAWETSFLANWYTEGLKNTQLNRFIRIKLFHIWLEILEKHAGSVIENAQKHTDIGDSYWFYTANENTEDLLPAEELIDFNQFKRDGTISFFNANCANEYLAFFYGLYQIFKAFKTKIVFDPAADIISWGSLSCNYRSVVNFEIDNDGNFNCQIDHQFKHVGLTPETKRAYEHEVKSANGDMSFKGRFKLVGNIAAWKTEKSMVKETVHEVYRNKVPKRIEAA